MGINVKQIALKLFFIGFLLLQLPCLVQAQTNHIDAFESAPNEFIQTHIIDQHTFYGLAGYYNQASFKIVTKTDIESVTADEQRVLGPDEWLTVIGRFNVLVVKSAGLSFKVSDQKITFSNPEQLSLGQVDIVTKNNLKAHAEELDQVRYSHLFSIINWLCRLIEAFLNFAYSIIGNWGLAIIALAVFLKILLLPLGSLVQKYQNEVSRVRTELEPKLAAIKENYKGEEAHKHFVAAHKESGVSTFYSLKPMIGLLVQLPVWIAVFNALAEMPQISNQSFLWVKDLVYPDDILSWSSPIPLIGNTLNVMPLLMTAVTILSTLKFKDKFASEQALKNQKRNLFFMAAAFLILFYPFPSGMVFYWTMANILNALPQLWTAIKR